MKDRTSEQRWRDGGRIPSALGNRPAESDRTADDLMTTREAAHLLRYDSPKTLRKKIAAGVFLEGVHFYKREGMQYRWIRAGLYAFLRGEVPSRDDIPRLAAGH